MSQVISVNTPCFYRSLTKRAFKSRKKSRCVQPHQSQLNLGGDSILSLCSTGYSRLCSVAKIDPEHFHLVRIAAGQELQKLLAFSSRLQTLEDRVDTLQLCKQYTEATDSRMQVTPSSQAGTHHVLPGTRWCSAVLELQQYLSRCH